MHDSPERLLYFCDLGLVDYDEAWAFQRAAAAARIAGKHATAIVNAEDEELTQGSASQFSEAVVDVSENTAAPAAVLRDDLLILCEHPPVVTLGRATKSDHLLSTPAQLEAVGTQLREVERGGDVTIHEPGQLVVYPIIDLERHRKDLHWYLRQVEEAIIVAMRTFDLEATRVPGLTGVWIDGRKLASIGVHARDWVTWHGVALNVDNDLSTFAHVVPCGIDQVTMTSVERECGRAGMRVPLPGEVRHAVINAFAEVFELQLRPLPADLQPR